MLSFRQRKIQLLIQAEKGDSSAQLELGLLYQKGCSNNPPNYAVAKRWLSSALQNGESDAHLHLKNLNEIESPLHYSTPRTSRKSYDQVISFDTINNSSREYIKHKALLQYIPTNIVYDLNQIIGLEDVKSQLTNIIIELRQKLITLPSTLRQKVSIETLHTIFTGNHGAGQTAIAITVGKILHHLNLAKSSRVFNLTLDSIAKKDAPIEQLLNSYLGKSAEEIVLISGLGHFNHTPNLQKEIYALISESIGRNIYNNIFIICGTEKEIIFLPTKLRNKIKQTLFFPDRSPEELYNYYLQLLSYEDFSITLDGLDCLQKSLLKYHNLLGADKINEKYIELLADKHKSSYKLRIEKSLQKYKHTVKNVLDVQDIN
jgi:hypothetical protein